MGGRIANLSIQPIAHQLKLPVRRYKANGPIVLEPTQPYALVELYILHLDLLPPTRPPRALEHDLVVQPEPELRHPRKVALHLYCAEDLRAQDVAVGVHQQVDGLDDVEE